METPTGECLPKGRGVRWRELTERGVRVGFVQRAVPRQRHDGACPTTFGPLARAEKEKLRRSSERVGRPFPASDRKRASRPSAGIPRHRPPRHPMPATERAVWMADEDKTAASATEMGVWVADEDKTAAPATERGVSVADE